MYRSGSFASSSQYSIRSLATSSNDREARPNDDDGRTMYFKSKGNLPVKTLQATTGGRLLTFCNYPVRNRQWNMELITFHPNNGAFAIADERGQVYYLSVEFSLYQSVRFASTKVLSMCFLPLQKTHLMIAYESGANVIIDTLTTDIVGNFQFPFNYGAVKLLAAHPKEHMVAMVQGHYTLVLWNLATSQCTETLECHEVIVDVQFEIQGKFICILLEKSGMYVYATSNLQLCLNLRCPLNAAIWLAFCSIEHKIVWKHEKVTKAYLQFVLSSSDNRLFSAFVELLDGSTTDKNELLKCHSFVAFDLPSKMDAAISLANISSVDGLPRLAALGKMGDIMLLQMEHIHEKSPGYFIILADMPPQMHPPPSEAINVNNMRRSSSFISLTHFSRAYPEKVMGKHLMQSSPEHLLVIGTEGTARLFKIDKMVNSVPTADAENKHLTAYDPNHQMSMKVSSLDNELPPSGKPALKQPAQRKKHTSQQIKVEREVQVQEGGDLYEFYVNNDEDESEETKRNSQTKTTTKTTMKSKISSTSTKNAIRNIVKTPIHSFVTVQMKRGELDVANTALFELASLTPKERRVNYIKLKAFQEKHGEFPSRYRSLIWRFLLKLPENSQAFSDLVARGVHPVFDDMEEKYPIQTRKLFTRLQSVCSSLVYWAPILGESSYLPALVFPFLLIFGTDELAAVETVMSIYMSWGISWHSAHPNPPLHLLSFFTDMLKLHEPKLSEHLVRHQVAPGLLAWQMLSTMFTEVLSRSLWLKVLDFLFLDFELTAQPYLMTIALLKEIKGVLLLADTEQKIFHAVRSQQTVNFNHLLGYFKDVSQNTPERYLLSLSSKVVSPLHFEANGESVKLKARAEERDEARGSVALSNGRPLFPLPKGFYPPYDGFPLSMLNKQIEERERALAMGREVQRKERELKKLQEKVEQMEREHEVFMERQGKLTTAELLQRREGLEKEREYLSQLEHIENELTVQRVRALERVEAIGAEEVDALEKVTAQTRDLLQEQERHWREKTEKTLSFQRQREVAERAEEEVRARVRALRLMRRREEWGRGLGGLLRGQEEEMRRREEAQQEKWRREDEESRQRREEREEESRREMERERLSLLQTEAERQVNALLGEREKRLGEIERERQRRRAAEEAEREREVREGVKMWEERQGIESRLRGERERGGEGKGRAGTMREAEETLRESEESIGEERRRLGGQTLPSLPSPSPPRWVAYPSRSLPIPPAGAGVGGFGFGAPPLRGEEEEGEGGLLPLEEAMERASALLLGERGLGGRGEGGVERDSLSPTWRAGGIGGRMRRASPSSSEGEGELHLIGERGRGEEESVGSENILWAFERETPP